VQTLKIGTRGTGVAQVTMARAAVLNAFDEAMIGELDAAFAQLIDDPAVRVIVLAGGAGLACACDTAIASGNASFSVSEARFGILPANWIPT
jgi:enoyl-CoA hydratase/carnithine racemase